MAIQPDDYNNEDIAGQGDKIEGEEQCKKKAGESQEDKDPPRGCSSLPHSE